MFVLVIARKVKQVVLEGLLAMVPASAEEVLAVYPSISDLMEGLEEP